MSVKLLGDVCFVWLLLESIVLKYMLFTDRTKQTIMEKPFRPTAQLSCGSEQFDGGLSGAIYFSTFVFLTIRERGRSKGQQSPSCKQHGRRCWWGGDRRVGKAAEFPLPRKMVFWHRLRVFVGDPFLAAIVPNRRAVNAPFSVERGVCSGEQGGWVLFCFHSLLQQRREAKLKLPYSSDWDGAQKTR